MWGLRYRWGKCGRGDRDPDGNASTSAGRGGVEGEGAEEPGPVMFRSFSVHKNRTPDKDVNEHVNGGDSLNSSLCRGDWALVRLLTAGPWVSLLRLYSGGGRRLPPGGCRRAPRPGPSLTPASVRRPWAATVAWGAAPARTTVASAPATAPPAGWCGDSRSRTSLWKKVGLKPRSAPRDATRRAARLRLRPELSFPGARRRGPVLQKSHFFQSLSLAFWVPAFFPKTACFCES